MNSTVLVKVKVFMLLELQTDEAALRPGRFGKKHYVPLHGADERVSILKEHARKKPISSGVDLDALARREECNNLTGADLASLVNEAAMAALEERLEFLENGASSIEFVLFSQFEQAPIKSKAISIRTGMGKCRLCAVHPRCQFLFCLLYHGQA